MKIKEYTYTHLNGISLPLLPWRTTKFLVLFSFRSVPFGLTVVKDYSLKLVSII